MVSMLFMDCIPLKTYKYIYVNGKKWLPGSRGYENYMADQNSIHTEETSLAI